MKKTPLTVIFLIVFIDLMGFGIIIPILPSYAQQVFCSSDVMVGVLVAAFSFMQLLFTPVWGRLSDRMGRKPVLVIGLVCTIAGYILFGFASSFLILFLARLLGGIGGANISAAQAYIADVTSVEDRAKGMGLIGAAFGLGFVFGPFIGGLLVPYGYEIPGFAAAALSTIALVTTIVFLPEPKMHAEKAAQTSSSFTLVKLKEALKKPKIASLFLLFFLVTFGYANIYATFPIISTREFDYTDRQVGMLFGFLGLIGAMTQGSFIRVLTKKIPEKPLFLIGVFFTMLGLTFLPFYISTAVLLIVLTSLSFGSGVVTPTALSLISQNTDARDQGSILGINQSLGALGRVLGPIWGSFVFQHFGHIWPFLTGGAVMLLVFILAWKLL